MSTYNYFSQLYDELTEDIDYTDWVKVIKTFNKTKILDVGCGTGNLLVTLNLMGYEVDGLDLSIDMLNIAKRKLEMNNLNKVALYHANMIDFKLNKYEMIICFFDTINHLKTKEDVINTINNLYNHLEEDGVLLIDAITLEKMKDIDNEIFEFDEPTYKATWEITCSNNLINHNFNFYVGDEIIKESYVETYFDLEEISPIKIDEKINNYIDNTLERIIYIIKKK